MKQPILTAIIALCAIGAGFASGHNYGEAEGLRKAASGCNAGGRFTYSKVEYACRQIETMTVREWAAKRESMK